MSKPRMTFAVELFSDVDGMDSDQDDLDKQPGLSANWRVRDFLIRLTALIDKEGRIYVPERNRGMNSPQLTRIKMSLSPSI